MINKQYCDENGYPGTIQGDGSYDGGDTAAIIGTIEALAPFASDLLGLPLPPTYNGIPLRHPDVTKWYGQPDRFSRDQLIPIICGGFGQILGYTQDLIYRQHKEKYFLTTWNIKGNGFMDMPEKFPDICGPEVWALWVRYKRPWWRHLVLAVLDVQTLIGAIQWRWFTPATNRVTRNHMLVSLTSRNNSPSVTSRLVSAINDYPELISRWRAHCAAVGEYPTADLFEAALIDHNPRRTAKR